MTLQWKDNDVPGTNDAGTLLSVAGLSVAYGRNSVVNDVGFTLGRGGSLALIGESGSGEIDHCQGRPPPPAPRAGNRQRQRAP